MTGAFGSGLCLVGREFTAFLYGDVEISLAESGKRIIIAAGDNSIYVDADQIIDANPCDRPERLELPILDGGAR